MGEHQLYGNSKKYEFWLEQIAFLGQQFSKRGGKPTQKVITILEWPKLICSIGTRKSLSLVGYY